MTRPIYDIAAEISSDWKKPYFGAVPYINAMHTLVDLDSRYVAEDAEGILRYFLANSGSWRGETAKRIKAEIKSLLNA